MLADLAKVEVAEREVRSINYQITAARFPAYRDLAEFSFEDGAVDVTLVKTLLSPDVQEAIVAGEQPAGLTLRQLMDGVALVW